MSAFCETLEDGSLRLRVKAIPGASRSGISGVVGDRLKIKVAAQPEGGKANRAIIALLAERLGVRRRSVTLESGVASPEKTFRVEGATAESVESLAS